MAEEHPIFSEKLTGIRVEAPSDYAAGPIAIQKSIQHLGEEMGYGRAFMAINKMNKKGGFDCPGCAWPDPDDKRSVLGEYCENGAKALAEEATLKKVDPTFFAAHSLSKLRSWSDFQIGKSGRLTAPMIKQEGEDHYQEITWNDAFEVIGAEFKKLENPNQALFYTSGRSSNEAAFLYGLLARRLGTNNLPDCSNMCHESSGVALSQTLGIGKGSVKLDDFEDAEVIMILGQNPGTNHPRMLTSLQKAKKKGAKIISINPLKEAGLKRFRNPQKIGDLLSAGTALTDVYLQIKINQDVALLQAFAKRLLELDREQGDIVDHAFIKRYTAGFESYQDALKPQNIEDLLNRSGIADLEFEEAIAILKPAKRIIICWAMGLTQHKNGVDNIKECVNLLLLKGSMGKRGAGTCPVRGHSNVQGDRTVGINHHLNPQLAERIKDVYHFDPPMEDGYDTVLGIQAMHEGNVKIFSALGGNLLAAASDTHFTATAIEQCNLTVFVSTKLCRTHLHPGKIGLILPTLGRSEKDLQAGSQQKVTVENSMGKVHASQGVLNPISSQLRSEPAIVCQMATGIFGNDDKVNWAAYSEDYSMIRKDIARVVKGFENYEDRVANGAEFYLPNNVRELDFSKLPQGKAQFSICSLPDHSIEDDEFLLTTIRSHDQFNTTIYGLDDRYRGIFGERRVVLINKNDLEKLEIQHLDLIDLSSKYNDQIRKVSKFYAVRYDIPAGNLAAYFPETNPLIPIDEYAIDSRTPISKSVKVRIHRHIPH